ncbi:sulfatase-like hydrolase/transferase [Agarivorans sp. TSD2052]|uniref:sulfatase-like hydrolase/transferase n=1 Tax=Agarivorans sp. TSD2052 TaxID=2937286 RepID=UPI00200E137C|nr:sulfatase-like hydrolase/transferase [Agarivorans sp. TSD2052]UPW20077.1 sulfatase-like hydrolase/transferase [Agarivorans sp. TSD2052]
MRVLLKGCLIVSVISLMSCGSEQEVKNKDVVAKPNIILIVTDDHGYADLGVQGQADFVKTPNIDQIAINGVRATSAYATAPQCTPSRGALITGRYQQRFGLEDTRFTPLPIEQITLPERLQGAGYVTGMVGKWHLQVDAGSRYWKQNVLGDSNIATADIPEETLAPYFPENRGFDDVFFGLGNKYWTNFDLEGNDKELSYQEFSNYRITIKNAAAKAFVRRHAEEPFFLYLSYLAPHTPLAALQSYLNRFPQEMPERRRHALAMLLAIDDGVGALVNILKEKGIYDNTLIMFASDNGAPLLLDMPDVAIPSGGAVWDGSLNTPWVGEKGMLTEGGIRVPMVMQWPDKLAKGLVTDKPLLLTDLTVTALAAAGVDVDDKDVDGLDLLPVINDDLDLSERELFWRFWGQSAIRKGKWKYLRVAENSEFLFDLSQPDPESTNYINLEVAVADELRDKLDNWLAGLARPGEGDLTFKAQEKVWYDFFLSDD